MMRGNAFTLRVNLLEDYSPDFENMTLESSAIGMLEVMDPDLGETNFLPCSAPRTGEGNEARSVFSSFTGPSTHFSSNYCFQEGPQPKVPDTKGLSYNSW